MSPAMSQASCGTRLDKTEEHHGRQGADGGTGLGQDQGRHQGFAARTAGPAWTVPAERRGRGQDDLKNEVLGEK